MTPTLVQQHHARPVSPAPPDTCARARDWAEIQERMLVPLFEAVYERLEAGPGTRLLGLGCGSGLALLMATARGAAVTGLDTDDQRLTLARRRLLPDTPPGVHEDEASGGGIRLLHGGPADTVGNNGPPFTMVTAFDPQSYAGGDLVSTLAEAAAVSQPGSPVVLADWGPPERCATSSVLRVAERLTDSTRSAPRRPGGWRPFGRDDLEDIARRAGLRLDGSGRVACPFGYADLDSALRGLLSTGLFDESTPSAPTTDRPQVAEELTEALHPHLRPDGTVWMPNVFRYLVARV